MQELLKCTRQTFFCVAQLVCHKKYHKYSWKYEYLEAYVAFVL